MKKYKLIKTYPLCPFELGAIATDENIKSDAFLSIRRGVGEYTVYSKDAIENNPEFWKEVKEKEYTILSFTDGSVIYNLDWAGSYIYIGLREVKGYSLESAIEKFKIHSVRRESDGEVFTLNDCIDVNGRVKITEIKINESFLGGIEFKRASGSESIEYAKKYPISKPILTTEDGVEIFEGDNYLLFSVWTEGGNWPERRYRIEQVGNVGDKWKHFHTKEAREEYIKWNKPLYSLNDITRAIFNANTDDDIIKELEKLVKK